MWTVELPFATWRAVIDTLRQHGVPYMTVHAAEIEQQLDQTPADQTVVPMAFTDDVYLRSINWACWQLGIPRPTARG